MPEYKLTINKKSYSVVVEEGTPLLWVLREHLGLTGTKYGCGIAQCGSCTVHVDGNATRSCVLTVDAVAGGQVVTTIEGLSNGKPHPLQKAWIEAQVPQCGYCQSGQIMQAAFLLSNNPNPSREEIIQGMNGNICRCGTYLRIIDAIQKVSKGELALEGDD